MPNALPDVEIASLLSEHLGNSGWSLPDSLPRDRASRALMASQALKLYDRTTPPDIPEAGQQRGWATEAHFAMGVLRDIADGYALLSNSWTPAEVADLPLPTRLGIEWFIHTHRVDEWAAQLGWPLRLDASAARDLVPLEMPRDPAPSDQTLAAAFTGLMSDYERLRATDTSTRDSQARDEARDAACRKLMEARYWIAWVRHQRPAAVEAVVAMRYVAEAFFVAWGSEPGSPARDLFPSIDYLRELLRDSDAPQWLRTHGAHVPWLP